jgi:hypothetical protein
MMLHIGVRNCFVASDGADSDHRVVKMELNLTSLKYKEKAPLNTGEGERYARKTNSASCTTNIF